MFIDVNQQSAAQITPLHITPNKCSFGSNLRLLDEAGSQGTSQESWHKLNQPKCFSLILGAAPMRQQVVLLSFLSQVA